MNKRDQSSTHTYDEVAMPCIFQNRVLRHGDRACVYYKNNGEYVSLSWHEMNAMIRKLAFYLLFRGIKKGDRVGLFSPNRYEWWVADQAIASIGAVNVPIYMTNSSEEAEFILKDSGSRACFAASEEHLAKLQKAKKNLPDLKDIIVFDPVKSQEKNTVSFAEAITCGTRSADNEEFDKRLRSLSPDDLSTIMYTSGTTGNPKGVMLTNNNFVSNVINTLESVKDIVREDDVFLSFLPLSHVLERTVGYHGPVYAGAIVAFAEDFSTIMENFQEIRPTVIVCVPRIYERIHAGILSKVSGASSVKKFLFKRASKAAAKNLPYVCTYRPRGFLFDKQFRLYDKLVFSKLKQALGMDRLRYAISGGAPLSIVDAKFFIGMGIEILEGFGLTETSPIICYNKPGSIKPGTIGQLIPQTTVKISDEGEILVKGPQVMKGYYNNPEAVKEVFTEDGYFKTGDLGVMDSDGFLTITGRIKDIIITAGGKNISPQNIENTLKMSRYIEQVAIIGDRRKYLSALIVPGFEELKIWASKNSIPFTDNCDLISDEKVKKLMEGEIEKYTSRYSRVEQIKKFTLLDAEWTQETGELTGKQSVKRRVIEKKYADIIEAMYTGE